MYGLGRALQILAMVDCGVALLIGALNPAAYAVQLVILGSAVILFAAGRLMQRRAGGRPAAERGRPSAPAGE